MRKDRALTPEQKMDARGALALLDGSGITLTQAARSIMNEDDNESVSTLLTVAIDAFLRDCIANKLRSTTIAFYSEKLETFSDTHANSTLDDLTRSKVMKWAMSLNGAKSTQKGYLNAVRAMLNWCHRQNPKLIRKDIGRGMTFKLPKTERNIDILTPAEAQLIMDKAGIYAPTLALMLFTGTRPSEIHCKEKPPILWGQVDPEEKIIRVSAKQAKTRAARPMENLPENLWTWLTPSREADEPIAPSRSRQAVRIAKVAIGHWPQDVCRHSFFTYHLA